MSYRPDYDIARHGEHKSYALQSERGFAPVGRSDLFVAQLGQPDVEDCSNGVIPDKAEPMDGKKKIHVPVLTTMNKVLFDHYRLSMYTYVNRLLRSGTLSRIVGARVLNRVVNREVLSFPSVSFWRIDRTNFYADVRVQLKLKTEKGSLVWIGYLVLWCAFNAEFECGIEELTDEVDRKADGYDPLDSHLIPYHNNRRVDAVSEGIWGKYLPEAIDDPQKRNPIALAEKMGLTVKYCRIYEHRGVSTILFFEEDDLVVGEDRIEKDESGKKTHIKAKDSSPVHIMGNTIVVNENLTRWEHSAYAQNQKAHLCAFLEHGEIEISNNQVENAIRPFVVGRKGWLFADTPQGAETSTIIYSLMETAKANSLRLDDYLLHLLSILPERAERNKDFEVDDLLPWSEKMKSWFSAV